MKFCNDAPFIFTRTSKSSVIMLKKSEHHHNSPLASYWHTSPNGMTQKAYMKAKEIQLKKTCQDFYCNPDISLVCFIV